MPKPLLLAVADLHLSGRRPGSRNDDWEQAQSRLMNKLTKTSKEYGAPVFVAGDIFDRAKEDPWVVSFAIRWMKQARWYGIPGQHDLPGHATTRIEESSFQNLVEAGVLYNVDGIQEVNGFRLFGLPYGGDSVDADSVAGAKDRMRILMGHQMVWESEPYPGAPEKGNVKKVLKECKGFDVLIFGDNHKGFTSTYKSGRGSTVVIVPGTAMRRHRDDIEYKPMAWLLYDDKTVVPVSLPKSHDEFVEASLVEKNEKLTAFVESLVGQAEVSLSFVHNLKCFLDESSEVSKEVRDILWASMEGK